MAILMVILALIPPLPYEHLGTYGGVFPPNIKGDGTNLVPLAEERAASIVCTVCPYII